MHNTTSTYEFFSYLRNLDIKLFVDGENLRCNAPKGAITPTLQREISERKADILAFLHQANAASSHLAPILPISRNSNIPVSFAQERIWLLEQLRPSSVYNLPLAFRLEGRLNVTALEQSLSEIVCRHEILRTTFLLVDGQPTQVIAPALSLTLPIINLEELPLDQRETELERQVKEDAQQPFDLTRGPLWRAKLLRLAETEYIFLLTMHHIVSDGWSFSVFFQELRTLYTAFSTGNNLSLANLPIQYADFAHWQRQWLQGEVLESQLAYWKQQLSGNISTLQLPTDWQRSPAQNCRSASQSLVLPRNLTEALKVLSRQEGVSLFVILLTAFNALLYGYTGQEDIIVCSPVSGRNRIETEGLIGFFNNIVLIRTNLSGNPSIPELVGRVKQVVLGADEHQDLPVQKLADLPNLVCTPLTRAMFALQNTSIQPVLPGITVSSLNTHNGTANFDLSFSVQEAEQLIGVLEYKTELFKASTITQILQQFQALLESIVANPAQHLSSLPRDSRYNQGRDVISKEQELNSCLESCNSGFSRPKAAQVGPRAEIELKLAQIWQSVLGVPHVGIHDNFFELGGSSLLALNLFSNINQTFGINLPLSTLFQAATVAQLANILDQPESGLWSPLVAIQSRGSKPPLFGIHALYGHTLFYRDLALHLGPEQPFYGLQAQGLDGKQAPLKRIEDMAAHYIKEIRTIQPDGPYFLVGFSLGGIIAFEMAQQLHGQNQKVALLALIDAVGARDFDELPLCKRLTGHLRNFFRQGPTYIKDKLQEKLQAIAPQFYPMIEDSLPDAPHRQSVMDANRQAIKDYAMQVYPGQITFFQALDSAGLGGWEYDAHFYWSRRTTASLALYQIPCGHDSMIKEPHVRSLAAQLRACLDKAQAAKSGILVNSSS